MLEVQIDPQDYIELAKRDKQMALAIQQCAPIHRKGQIPLFESLVDSFIAQVISKQAAITLSNRLRVLYPELKAMDLAKADPLELRQLSISWKKANWIIQAAQRFVSKEFDEEVLKTLSDEEFIASLVKLEGVGRWTAEMLLIFFLNRPNVISYGDFAIRKGIQLLYHHKTLDKKRFNRYQKRYAPYNTAASLILWYIAENNIVFEKIKRQEILDEKN